MFLGSLTHYFMLNKKYSFNGKKGNIIIPGYSYNNK